MAPVFPDSTGRRVAFGPVYKRVTDNTERRIKEEEEVERKFRMSNRVIQRGGKEKVIPSTPSTPKHSKLQTFAKSIGWITIEANVAADPPQTNGSSSCSTQKKEESSTKDERIDTTVRQRQDREY
jgi:hypothetical protein